MMRRMIALLMTLACLLLLPSAQAEDALLAHAAQMASELDTLAESPLYTAAMGASEGIQAIITQFAEGEYDAPAAAWRTGFKADALTALMGTEMPLLPEELVTREMTRRLLESCSGIINGQKGVEAVAASSMLTISRAFPAEGLESGSLYLLQYENGLPVIVSFWPEGNGVALATARFVMTDDPAALFRNDEMSLMFTEPESLPLE